LIALLGVAVVATCMTVYNIKLDGVRADLAKEKIQALEINCILRSQCQGVAQFGSDRD
jgi:riboflavin synthase alpha subunit